MDYIGLDSLTADWADDLKVRYLSMVGPDASFYYEQRMASGACDPSIDHPTGRIAAAGHAGVPAHRV
jgi:hypothetical protein